MVRTIENLERSIHKTNKWINELTEELDWDNQQNSYNALEGTLRVLRDMLTIEEATDFGAQLPLILRGTYYTNWDPSNKPIRIDKPTFVSKVHSHMKNNPDIDPHATVLKVFSFLNKKIVNGELKDVRAQLPEDIKNMWKAMG